MASLTGQWTRVAASNRLQRSSQCVSVVGNQAWIFGGELEPRQPVDNRFDLIELADGPSNAQTLDAHDKAPSPRVGSTSAVLGDTIYFFSGRGGIAMAPIEEEGRLWSYNTSTSQWNLLSPANESAEYPVARSYHAMTSDNKHTLYVHAGCPEKGRLSDLWSFNVDRKVWKELASAPDPPRGGTSITYGDGHLYRMNGFDGKTEQGGNLDVYDVSTNKWSTITYHADGKSGPEARSVSALLALTIMGRKYLVTLFGEHDPSSLGHAGAGKMLANAWAYNFADEQWTEIWVNGDQPQARGWFDADVTNGKEGAPAIVMHGGLSEANDRLGDIWMLRLK